MTTSDSDAGLSGARLTAVAVAARTRILCRRHSICLENGGSPCGGPYEFATAPAHLVRPRQDLGGARYEMSAGPETEIQPGMPEHAARRGHMGRRPGHPLVVPRPTTARSTDTVVLPVLTHN
ncbi:hypothetical protein AB5J72_02510 [Streptomyces sp. CG1]|uniref:hypothetical protein n=1 Tax=Streptomyces sp. CG1 TaxID=1287523 RepID=UPI0034E1D32D